MLINPLEKHALKIIVQMILIRLKLNRFEVRVFDEMSNQDLPATKIECKP